MSCHLVDTPTTSHSSSSSGRVWGSRYGWLHTCAQRVVSCQEMPTLHQDGTPSLEARMRMDMRMQGNLLEYQCVV